MHEDPIRATTWSHNMNYFLAGDDGGRVKYYKANIEQVQTFMRST
jgi:hypothetical protein